MRGIQRAKALFYRSNLFFPSIPEELAIKLEELGEWAFSTPRTTVNEREYSHNPYNLREFIREVEETNVEEYAILCHSGHGINSYALHYYLVYHSLEMFLQLNWGGVYIDKKKSRAEILECFLLANQIVATLDTTSKLKSDEKIRIVASHHLRSYWCGPIVNVEKVQSQKMQNKSFEDSKRMEESEEDSTLYDFLCEQERMSDSEAKENIRKTKQEKDSETCKHFNEPVCVMQEALNWLKD